MRCGDVSVDTVVKNVQPINNLAHIISCLIQISANSYVAVACSAIDFIAKNVRPSTSINKFIIFIDLFVLPSIVVKDIYLLTLPPLQGKIGKGSFPLSGVGQVIIKKERISK